MACQTRTKILSDVVHYHITTSLMKGVQKVLSTFISGHHSKKAQKISVVKILELMFLYKKLWKPLR